MAEQKAEFRLTQVIPSAVKAKMGSLVDVLLPPTCLACETIVGRQGGTCPSCWAELQFIERPYCTIFGTPFSRDLGPDVISAQAIADPPDFDRARSAVLHDQVSRKIVSGLKFSDRADLAPWMAEWMARAGADLVEPGARLVPVPLHRRRLFSRRYNQSADLARHLARIWKLDYDGRILMRTRATRQQVGLNAKGRQLNVRGAFRVPHDQEINVRGQHLILVDDVYTTGATLQACSRALRRKGAQKIDCLTFSRVGNGVANNDQ